MSKGRSAPEDEGPPGSARYEEPLTEMDPSLTPRRPYLAMSLGGMLGGLLGVAAGNIAVHLLLSSVPASHAWMKGEFGPPFFCGALSTAFYYSFLGAGMARGKLRINGAGIGFFVFFLFFALPLAALTRLDAFDQFARGIDYGWFSTVFSLLALSSGITLWLLGSTAEAGGPGFDAVAGFGALGGAVAAYLAFGLLVQAVPALRAPLTLPGLLPAFPRALDGALSGLLTGLAAAFACRLKVIEPEWY